MAKENTRNIDGDLAINPVFRRFTGGIMGGAWYHLTLGTWPDIIKPMVGLEMNGMRSGSCRQRNVALENAKDKL